MKLERSNPLGAVLDDCDVRLLDDDGYEHIRACLAECGVVVLKKQTVGDEEFVTFLSGLGPLMFTAGEAPVSGCPQLNTVTNVGRTQPPVSNWHVDTAYVDEPPSYTSLRAVRVPDRGGATLFTNQYDAFDTLSTDLRRRLEGRSMTHVVTGVDPGPGEQTAAVHPLVRPHPRTGRPALWLDAPGRCGRITGLDLSESEELVAELLRHSTSNSMVWRHDWSDGDIVVWDNAVVMHRADHSDVSGDRILHRGMVASSGYRRPDGPSELQRP